MAQSPKTVEQRVEKLETDVSDIKGAIVQMTQLFVEHSQRVDTGFKHVGEELRRQGERTDANFARVWEELRRQGERSDALTERMDG